MNFTTLDYQELDRDLGRVLDGATGDFRSQFEAGTNDLAELVTANQAVSKGEVLEAGIVSDDDDSARVLVVADSTVTNAASPRAAEAALPAADGPRPRRRPLARLRPAVRRLRGADDDATATDRRPAVTRPPRRRGRPGWGARRNPGHGGPGPSGAPPPTEPTRRARRPPPATAGGAGRTGPWCSSALAVVLVLAVTAVAADAVPPTGLRTASSRPAPGGPAAAEAHAVTLLSYDHRHLDRDFAVAREVLTGGFADDYATTTERVVRPSAEEVKAVVTAEVASSSVVRAAENQVVVLLFVDQTTTSTRLEGPKVDLNRVRMTMTRVGQQWLVSGVDAL